MSNSYYQWLISQVSNENHDSRYYSKLLYDLDSVEFTWTIQLDENRAWAGLRLRGDDSERNGPCTVLEMMVALSLRVEREYIEEGEGCDFFWSMIKSLGLYFNDDYNYNHEMTVSAIDRLLNHTYQSDGYGGLFVVKKPLDDMRKTNIWQQAMWYLNEIYSEKNKGWLDE